MSLTDRINEDLKNAMKARDEGALRALRAIKAALLLAKTDKGGGDAMNEGKEISLLQRLAKQRRESLEIYETQGRADLAAGEREELGIIEQYLPKQLSEADVRAAIKEVIQETGAKSATDISKVMPAAMKKLAGKTDGKTISAIVKEELS
ncbi:MAG: GatB/YqeY domain-containing protein [Bacteroidota bacterium]|nr:GatB/YqeY domain-containing protein [Bacteroidota bacterium]